MKYYGLITFENNLKDYGFIDDADPRRTDEMLVLSDDEWQRLLNEQAEGKQIVFYEGKLFTADPDRYYVDENYIWQKRSDEEYAKFKKARNAEFVQGLSMTKRVLWLQLKELGISYKQLTDLIASDEDAQAEWELCERLERSNPLLDIMGKKLNITSEQIDEMFIKANGGIE